MLAVVAALVAAAGCGGDSERPATQVDADRPFEVTSRTETFVDRSRPTAAAGDQAARPERTLATITYYPVGDGRFPLVVFAHGNTVADPGYYRVLLDSWAAAGYVVAAPIFPLSSTRLPGGGGDLVNQPADVSFVISEMLRMNGEPGGPYTGRVDPGRIGVAGHSLGAMTTLGVGFHSCCLDDRVRAGIVLAGRERPFPTGSFFPGVRSPILIVHGDSDPLIPLEAARQIYDDALGPRFMVTIVRGDHDSPYAGINGQIQPETRLVMTATRDFLDHYLKDQADGLDRLRDNLAGQALARLEMRA
ncbi:MAG TPA: hypothetical protein VGV86_11670 [Acidimicrobiales bacterium]|nr:hypothetical protein [Acidimicrobiales bacterium]